MTKTKGEKVAVSAILCVGTLFECAEVGVGFIWCEDFINLLCEEVGEVFVVL